MNKTGSALIFITILLSFVGIIAIVCTRSTMLYYGFAVDRLQHTRQQLALNALAEYGIACGIANKQPQDEHLKQWPPPDGPYVGTITLSAQDKQRYQIRAMLYQDDLQVGAVACNLHVEEKKAIIDEWHYLHEKTIKSAS